MKRNFDRGKGVRSLLFLRRGYRVFVDDVSQQDTVLVQREKSRSYDVRLDDGTEIFRN